MGTITICRASESVNTTGTQYRYWSYEGAGWREGVRGGNWVRDKTLTATGWDGVMGPGDGTGDWENIYEES